MLFEELRGCSGEFYLIESIFFYECGWFGETNRGRLGGGIWCRYGCVCGVGDGAKSAYDDYSYYYDCEYLFHTNQIPLMR